MHACPHPSYRHASWFALILGLLLLPTPRALAQCVEAWAEGFGHAEADGGIHTMVVWDDGTGPALFVGGQFTNIGGILANGIAKWDGCRWHPLGDPRSPGVMGAEVPLGFLSPGWIYTMTVFDDDGPGPNGPSLFVGGAFNYVNVELDPTGFPIAYERADHVVKWDGERWHALEDGSGFPGVGGTQSSGAGPVLALEVHDDGSGPALYVGGDFTRAGSVLLFTNHALADLVRWNGTNWSIPTSNGGFDSVYPRGVVTGLRSFDDGLGLALYVGGSLPSGGGDCRLWRGGAAAWQNADPDGMFADAVTYLGRFHEFDWDGAGVQPSRLYWSNGGTLQEWNSGTQSWNSVATGALALGTFDDGSGGGPSFYVSERVQVGANVSRLSRFDGTSLIPVSPPVRDMGEGQGSAATVLCAFDDGGGSALYAGGWLPGVDDVTTGPLIKWDGARWHPATDDIGGFDNSTGDYSLPWGKFGQPLRGVVWDDDGPGSNTPALYCANLDDLVGNTGFQGVVRWDGLAWTPVGQLVPGDPLPGSMRLSMINEPVVFDDGSGETLYVAVATTPGAYTYPPPQDAWGVYRWRPSVESWEAVGPPLGFFRGGQSATLLKLHVVDLGTPTLFVTGNFDAIGTTSASVIARWDPSAGGGAGAWQPVGALGGVFNGPPVVQDVAAFDDGGGPMLHVAGYFTTSGGPWSGTQTSVAKWDGAAWNPLGPTFTGASDLHVFDDGTGGGPALFVTGSFSNAGGVPADNIAKWNGTSWSPLGSGLSGQGVSMISASAGALSGLYVAGSFTFAGGDFANNFARWDGANWSGLGFSYGDPNWGIVPRLFLLDDGGGLNLFVADIHGSYNDPYGSIFRWDGTAWTSLGELGLLGGPSFTVEDLEVFDDGAGGGPAIYALGAFEGADGYTSRRIARWGDGPPRITAHPVSNSVAPGSNLSLACHAYGAGPLAFQWRQDNVDIPGATRRRLTIQSVGASDTGLYTCVVSNACGENTSAAALVTVITPCPGDYNDDGVVDLADLISFNTDWQPNIGQSVPPGTMGDYNADGVVDLADLIGFNTDWQPNIGVACP